MKTLFLSTGQISKKIKSVNYCLWKHAIFFYCLSTWLCIMHCLVYVSLRGHSITTGTRRGGKGVSRKSMLDHVTKGRYHIKCPQLSTRGGEGIKIVVKFGPRSCLTSPNWKEGRKWNTSPSLLCEVSINSIGKNFLSFFYPHCL